MRIVAVILTVAALMGSPAAQASDSAARQTVRSGLFGFVRRGTATPFCRVRPCTAPVPNVTLLFARNGSVVARARTGLDGSYRVALAPGSYTVELLARLVAGLGLRPSRVGVPEGRFARADFSIGLPLR